MKTKLLKLASVVTTAGTQIRAKIDADTVEQYAEAMQDATNKFPPVVVFHDGSQFILADGFHRVMAASRNGFIDIEAEVNKGTRADALKFALGANSTHGLKRTNADKRRCVELALDEWPKMSDREISKVCAVSNHFVGDVRKVNCELNTVETRIGADGKERRMPKRKEGDQPDTSESRPMTARDIREAAEPETEPAQVEATEPTAPRCQDDARQKAIGCTDARNYFASQLEDIGSSCLEMGSIEQIQAFKLQCEVWTKKATTAIAAKKKAA